jgi:hypothetical protein
VSKEKLKEYVNLLVEEALAEDDGGGDGGSYGFDVASYGGYGTSPGILRAIGGAIGDTVKTAGYAVSKVSAAAQTLIKGLAYIIPTILIPGLEFNYALFKKDEDVRLAEIKKEYGDVLGRNWEALKDPDVFGFMFLAYPQAMLGFSALKRSPVAFLRVLETVTGGMDAVTSLRTRLGSSAAYTPRTTPPGAAPDGGGGMGYGDYGDSGGGFGESVVRGKITEQNPPAQVDPQTIQQIWALMQTPEVQQAIAQAPMFKQMQAAAVDIMVGPAQRFMQVQNLDQMKGFIDPAAVEKAKAELSKKLQAAKPEESQQIAAQLLTSAKNAYKEEYIKKLTATAAGSPQAKPEVEAAIARIRGLK